MTLWIVMAVLAAATSLPLLVALYRGRDVVPPADAAMAIYRDQLGEVEREVARGVIPAAEAVAARTEIARRLIHAHDASPVAVRATARARTLAATAIVAAPIAALALYLLLGSPEYSDVPLAARATDQQDIPTLVAKVEAHLAAAPDDGKGWALIAPIYMKLGRFNDAVAAYRNAIRTLGETAEREADLGEALIGAASGTVTPGARAAFVTANQLDPTDPRPRFYLALALGDEGKTDAAIAAWQALLAGAPADAPWVPVARAQLAKLQSPGPTADDVAAAANLHADQRVAMVEGMVATLAAKLAAAPNDADGWARLIRSYMVLNRPEDARAALASAIAAFPGDAAKRAGIEAAAKAAGLGVEAP